MRPIADLMMALSWITDDNVCQIRKTAEDPPRICVYDLIGLITGQAPNARGVIFKRLTESFPEVSTFCCDFRFPGQGQQQIPVTCARGAALIVMLLPGKTAARVRKEAAAILVRYLGGDLSLVDEIARNHLTQQQLDEDDPARIFGQTVESDRVKRAREEVTIAELDGQLKRRKIESIQFCLQTLDAMGSDDRDRLRLTDMVRTVAFGSTSSTEQQADKETCIRQVIMEQGRTRETGLDCKVGKLAKKMYLSDHPDSLSPRKISMQTVK